uniref:7TM_GPCR_Srx domain-containing protein n=1 Tax=Panagrellus redivivus TaxID=6233 RepID=A0A7E4W1S7_PANRE
MTKIDIYLFYPPIPEMGYHIRESIPGVFQKSHFLIGTFGLTGTTTLFMNLYISYFLIRSLMPSGGRGASQDHDEASPTNVRFFAFNIFVFFLELCTAALQAGMAFFPTQYNTNPFLYFLQLYVAEANALGPAWFMLVINRPLRNDIMRVLRQKRRPSVNVVVSMKSLTVSITP